PFQARDFAPAGKTDETRKLDLGEPPLAAMRPYVCVGSFRHDFDRAPESTTTREARCPSSSRDDGQKRSATVSLWHSVARRDRKSGQSGALTISRRVTWGRGDNEIRTII